VRLGRWNAESPAYAGRRAHLQRLLQERNWRDLRRFVMPVPWIDRHWT
jgi:hypothetical protein